MNIGTLFAALSLLTLGWAHVPVALAAEPPALPCADAAFPSPPAVGVPPAITLWSGSDLGPSWQPPACTGWQAGPTRRVITVTGQFRGPANADQILARGGSMSLLRSVRYWSVTGKRWKDLLSSAQAVTAADGRQARADFSAAEMRSGQDFYFVLNDSGPASSAVFRGRVRQATNDRVAVEIENVTTIKFLIPLFHPGDIKSFCIIRRQPDGAWSYHALVRIDANATSMGQGDGGSYVNRAIAYYRHIAGIPTDQEPPAVR